MATTKSPQDEAALEDTEDILEEVGAERDEDGNLVVDEEVVRREGAVDSESILKNRRRRAIAAKRRAKQKFQFDTDDPLDKYDTLLRSAPASSFYIKVKRMTGPDLSDFIRSCPASGVDLFEALKAIHGVNPSYQYRLEIMNSGKHSNAAAGNVTVPDTRPMHMREPYYPQQQAQQAPQPPQQAPQAPAPNPSNPVEQFGQMFEMFQRFAGKQQPPQGQTPAAPTSQQPDMAQMFELFMKMQGGAPPPPVVQAPAPQQIDPFQQMSQMLELMAKFQALQPKPEPARPAPRAYDPGERRFGPPPYGRQPPPQQDVDPIDALIEAEEKRVARSRKLAALFGVNQQPQQPQQLEPDEPDEPNDPYYTQEIGKVKVIRRRDDDEVQPWASIGVNLPDALKWASETYDKFKKEAETRRQQEAAKPRRVLPPGYIEVIPGEPIQVPDGYRVAMVDPSEVPEVPAQQPVITPAPEPTQELPPVPANVPPPIQDPWSQPIQSRERD